MVNGLDLYYYECLVCNKYYSTPRDCTYKEFRFVTRAELADHISKFHPTKTNNKAVKLHGDQCLKARWHGLGPKNDYILNSGPFDYKAQTASVVPGSNVEQQEAVEAVKAEKKRQNSFRISKLDKHIFLAAHPGLNALAESAAEVVRQTIVREHGGGKEGADYVETVRVVLDYVDPIKQAYLTFSTHTDADPVESAHVGGSEDAAIKRAKAGMGVAHSVVCQCSVGASSMPVCGASGDGKSTSYGHCLGTYSSFPADLKHHFLGIGKKAYQLQLAFFFRVLKLNAETDQNASVPKRKGNAEPAEATRKSWRFATPASARV